MAFFAGSSDRYMSVRDRAVQRQRDDESRVHSLRKFANDLTMAEVAVGRDDAVEAKRRKAEREAIEHEEMMEKMTRTVGSGIRGCAGDRGCRHGYRFAVDPNLCGFHQTDAVVMLDGLALRITARMGRVCLRDGPGERGGPQLLLSPPAIRVLMSREIGWLLSSPAVTTAAGG
jgi:hypothetical protein